jgi:hypothetical protein
MPSRPVWCRGNPEGEFFGPVAKPQRLAAKFSVSRQEASVWRKKATFWPLIAGSPAERGLFGPTIRKSPHFQYFYLPFYTGSLFESFDALE